MSKSFAEQLLYPADSHHDAKTMEAVQRLLSRPKIEVPRVGEEMHSDDSEGTLLQRLAPYLALTSFSAPGELFAPPLIASSSSFVVDPFSRSAFVASGVASTVKGSVMEIGTLVAESSDCNDVIHLDPASAAPPPVPIETLVEPKSRHVVGRQSSYWTSSRRHLLMRGKPHAELAVQSSISTRDYLAATITVTTMVVQEEDIRRAAVMVEERTHRCALLLRLHQWVLHLSTHVEPLASLSLVEHRRRTAIIDAERKAFDRLFSMVCSGMLIGWASRDRAEARENLHMALDALSKSRVPRQVSRG